MEYLDFLDDDDRGKIELLMILQLYNDQFLTKKKLISLAGLSKFLLEKYLMDLEQDCSTLSITEEIFDELIYDPISNESIQKLKYKYIKRSLRFRFFIEVLVEEKSIKKFQTEQHVATTTLYQIRTKVLSCLKKERIIVRKNKLLGDEMKIRSIIFDIIFHFYFGEKYPFADEINLESNQLLTVITNYFNLNLTFLKKKKLTLFMSILQTRVKNRHILEVNVCTLRFNSKHTFASQLETLEKALYLSMEIPIDNSNESNYILLFLFVVDILDSDITINQTLLSNNQASIDKLVHLLATAFHITQQQQDKLHDSFLKKSLGLSLFRQNYTTFIDTSAQSYFSEVYSPLHRLILKYIRKDSFITSLNLSRGEQSKLYYDLMFSTLCHLDPKQLNKPINIFIDFSHGDAYNNYIDLSLKRFRDLNIVIQEKFNNDTNIFLSDYRITEVKCQQIIWKQPPTPSDWAKFADIVIDLRESENERTSIF